MEEASGRECEESRLEDRSCSTNEMEARSDSDRGGDEVYSATFGDEEIETGLMMMIIITGLEKLEHG